MRAWESIINTAMLGTDKPAPVIADLPEEVAIIANAIDSTATLDKEERYLQKAAVIYNYRQSGFVPFQKNDLTVNKADEETKPYCPDVADAVLNEILAEDNDPLLKLWLQQCSERGQLLLPGVLPAIMDKSKGNNTLSPLVIECSGSRGAWLSKLNPKWDFFVNQTDEEIWQTGTPTQRIELLKKIRKSTPDKAREWLQQTWAQENAANKLELLKTLLVNRSPADLPFLESLLTEKGQKVKDEAINLLKQIPGSSIVKQYEEILRQSIILKKEKALLGMMTKVSIQQKLPEVVDEHIFKTGIERLASIEKLVGVKQTNTTDEIFILYQLIGWVPPSFWVKQFEVPAAQVVEYFDKYTTDMVGAVGMAVARFGEYEWMQYFLHVENKFFDDFADRLPRQERDEYILRIFKQETDSLVHTALFCKDEWGDKLALKVIAGMADNPYKYNRQTINQHIGLIPIGVLNQIENITSQQEALRPTWDKTRNHLINLLSLKQQTLKAFNA
ncbi:DUF5691 domain-containing protein [Mucilaginibacter sp.]|uniref:DUF5691 domain-containing protein n=1 Tax=Mucilaginibacter sp. TaxID=1882438 RepID=UPI002ED2EB6C